jgi:hypothetical protein
MYFPLKSGRKVSVQQFLVRSSSRGILEGSPVFIRQHTLKTASKEAERIFGPDYGFLLMEPPEGALPAYQVYVELLSYTPVRSGSDCSGLVVSWFEPSVPKDPEALISVRLQDIDWEKHARDADY